MANTRTALLLLTALACAPAASASPSARTSAPLAVSLTVVDACGVDSRRPGAVDVRCTRGGTDRVVVAAAQPKLVSLEPDGRALGASIDPGQLEETRDGALLTLQF